MDTFSDTPFVMAPVPGRLGYPAHSLTIVVKATFDLVPGGVMQIADDQLPPTGDEFYDDDDDQVGSRRYASDLAYFKPRTDVMLVGSCHVPGGRPTDLCEVTLSVDDTTASLVVIGDRMWHPGVLAPRSLPATPFTTMPLRYENAYGGPDFNANPVGKGAAMKTGEAGTAYPLPNLEDPGNLITSTSSSPRPACFGPTASDWSPRAGMVGTYGGNYLDDSWPWFPEDFNWSHFNAAPEALQIEGFLRGDEEIRMTNVHPVHADYRCRLPGLRVRCFLNEQSSLEPDPDAAGFVGTFREVPLNIDTLWIDAENEQAVVLWRGAVPVSGSEFEEVTHAFVMSTPMAEPENDLPACRDRFVTVVRDYEAQWQKAPTEAPVEPEPEDAEDTPQDQEDREAEEALDAQIADLEAQTRRAYIAAGIDPSNPPPPTPEEEAEANRLLGIHDDDEDEDVPPAEPIPWTRERVAANVHSGEPMAGEDLRGLDLSGLDLTSADFSAAVLTGVSFRGATLQMANLTEADAHGADFTDADLSGANATRAVLTAAVLANVTASSCDFTEVVASSATFEGATLTGSSFENADLHDARFVDVTAEKCVFEGADLSGLQARGINLGEAVLSNARLTGADLTDATMAAATITGCEATELILFRAELTKLRAADGNVFVRANLQQIHAPDSIWSASDLTEANLSYAEMEGAALIGTDLQRANAYAANLKFAHLTKADLRGARMSFVNAFGATFEKADLTDADLSESNCFGAEFLDATIDRTGGHNANFTRTKLARR